jgi:Amt family ammonium transporter
MMKGMLGDATWPLAPTIPLLLFAMYQLKFAIITPALITGAFAERIRFNSYIIFVILFSIFIFRHWRTAPGTPMVYCLNWAY